MAKKPAAKAVKNRSMEQIVKSIKESIMDAHIMRIENAAFKLNAQETKKGDFLFPTEASVDKFDAIVQELNCRVKEETAALKTLSGQGKGK